MSNEQPDQDIERLWAEEIKRRLKEFDEGRVKPISWSEARASILSRRPSKGSRPGNKH
jgi:hypothetical protein